MMFLLTWKPIYPFFRFLNFVQILHDHYDSEICCDCKFYKQQNVSGIYRSFDDMSHLSDRGFFN